MGGGYKITNGDRSRKIGVYSSCFQDLKTKGCKKLSINVETVQITLWDGTIIDEEYFLTIPPQTTLIFRNPGEKVITGVDVIYGALKSVNVDLLKAAAQTKFFFDRETREKLEILANCFLKEETLGSSKSELSLRSQDPDWFRGLETRVQTKEAFMRKRCKGRIQGYLYASKDDVKKSKLYEGNEKARVILDRIFGEMSDRLSQNEFQCFYFDKSDKRCLCHPDGTFACRGVWNNISCQDRNHIINPYVSREARIIFGTWNLDHRIERTRQIIPTLLKCSEFCCNMGKNKAINSEYFYELLFTIKNLKLVHVVCHDKTEHKGAKCDMQLCFIRVDLDISKGKMEANCENGFKRNCIKGDDPGGRKKKITS